MTAVIIFLAILAILIFVHEFGHFFVAKKLGVRVDEFAIGFPPKIFSWTRGGTEYSLNWIPLGGFVRIKGESGEYKEDEDSFSHKSIISRFLILIAGVTMNFVTAVVLLGIALMIGVALPAENVSPFGNPTIEDSHIQIYSVLPDSSAEQSKLHPGDEILSINGQYFTGIEDMKDYIAKNADNDMSFEISRDDASFTKTLHPTFIEELDRSIVGVELVSAGLVRYPWYSAFIVSVKKNIEMIIEILKALGALIMQFVHPSEQKLTVAGPVGIAVMTGQVVALGFSYVLQFAAFLSVNLALINVLPIPALDGGRILFLIIEAIKGKSVDVKLEGTIHTIGFIFLMLLMVLVTFQDIGRYGASWVESFMKLF